MATVMLHGVNNPI